MVESVILILIVLILDHFNSNVIEVINRLISINF